MIKEGKENDTFNKYSINHISKGGIKNGTCGERKSRRMWPGDSKESIRKRKKRQRDRLG